MSKKIFEGPFTMKDLEDYAKNHSVKNTNSNVHLPNPDSLGNDGYFISNKNGDVLQTESKPVVFSTSKQAQAVKAYAKLTLLMEYCNCCKPKDNFVYKVYIARNGVIDTNIYESNQMRMMDIYFQNYSDVEKLISDPNWFRILRIYFRGEVNN